MPYRHLLPIVYKRLAEQWGISASPAECEAYGRSVAQWPAFPDSAEALNYLKQHYKLVILSNVDNVSFAGSNERLQVEFDAIITAEDVGSYKPSDRNFEYMLEKLDGMGVGRQDVLHTAESMFHDHVPGSRHQLASCWIYRRHDQSGFGATMNPGETPAVDFQFNSMADLVAAHQAALAT
jgi:putative hydrolase of the HAD superfamily